MSKKITAEMMDDIKITGNVEEEILDEVNYRTLFIGLGGTGGEVLCKLRRKLTEEEASQAHMLYLDTDAGDVRKLRAMNIPSINISSSDTVRDVISYLGKDDGVLDWISADENDGGFLASKTDDGASQYRTKSRLCLAKLLSQNGNALERLLDELSVPGAILSNETLRVMIVSSVAGGTGAGTFIQVALYLREYFRNHGHKDITIMGLLACPDLFARTVADANVENMYANAYAAVRELNAMNLAVTKSKTSDGYGKSINIAINTKSEGLLFDSNHPLFSANTNNKPYDLLYFIDIANTEGGILRTMDQYYGVMADVVHTRLYSPIEEPIRSDESNELKIHVNYPTAIYGSAGYGRIRYPYHGILSYLAVRKTHDELDYTWSQLENDWARYKREQQLMAKASGRLWTPTSAARAKRFVSDMDSYMDERSSSPLRTLKGMVWDSELDADRAEVYLEYLKSCVASGGGFETDVDKKDSLYGLAKDEEVFNARQQMAALLHSTKKKYGGITSSKSAGSKDMIDLLQNFSGSAEAKLQGYISSLDACIPGRAQMVASVVAPKTAMDAAIAQQEKNSLNLYHGLLCINGTAVHPLAARYLLYRLRSLMETELNGNEQNLYVLPQALKLALDPERGDGKDITVSMRIKQLEKMLFIYRKGEAKLALEEYMKAYPAIVGSAMTGATVNLLREIYKRVLKVVDILIAQYEGLFDNLTQYKQSLAVALRQERDRHERSSDDRCIFINASREAKEYCYSGDLRTRDVLDGGNGEISSAAGKGIYEALMERTWKTLEKQETVLLTEYEQDEEEDTYADLGSIFENIISLYREYLMEKATHLDVSVVEAMVRESCRRVGLTEGDLTSSSNINRVRHVFEQIVDDAISKARPMLNFDANNSDPYFENENTDVEASTAKVYTHIGMSRKASKDLSKIYESDNVEGAISAFDRRFNPSRGLNTNDNFSQYELVCFSAVHCLQPTQIRKFRETYSRGYYPSYRNRLREVNSSQILSNSPHLDKRWHLREAMPYISRSMETAWYRKTAKAFIFEMLNRNLRFTVDGDGITCFNYSPDGKELGTYVRWPARQLVTLNDISRLLEYIQEHDDHVEVANLSLDEQIDRIVARLSEHTDSIPVYKAAVTTNPTLKNLRSNLLVRKQNVSTQGAGRKASSYSKSTSEKEMDALKKACAAMGVDEADVFDMSNTVGGLLEVAWLVHRSEEKQRRDHDFGEYIVAAALEIVEKLCKAMCGEEVSEDSDLYPEYQDLYNSMLEKFMEPFVVSILQDLKLMDTESLQQMDRVVYHRYLQIPSVVTDTKEFAWANKQLAKK